MSELNPYHLKDGRKSERVASLSSAAAGLLRDCFKSSSGALYFKKSLRRQGIGFRRCLFFDRSHPLTGCQRYCGRRRCLRLRPLPQCLFGRGSLIHASQALRPEKRGSPLPMGRTGTDSITLTLHCVRTRPAGNKVRLRLDFFNARFVLSGSVLHFAPDTSSEGERKRKTVTAGVPLLSTPSLSDSQSGIAPLALRSLSCRAYMLQGLQFLRCGGGIYADCAEPILVSSPFTAPIPPPPLRHSSPFRRSGSHVRSALPFHPDSTISARAGKTTISRLDHHSVRFLPRLAACLLTLRKTERTMLTHRPFRLPTSRAEGLSHAPMLMHSGSTSHAGSK